MNFVDNTYWQLDRKILSYLSFEFKKNPEQYSPVGSISEIIQEQEGLIIERCRLLYQNELVKILQKEDGKILYKITEKGTQDLNTTYNPEWIEQQEIQKDPKYDQERQRKLQFEIEERRHLEMLKASKSSPYPKIISVVAIVIAVLALVGVDEMLFTPTIQIQAYFDQTKTNLSHVYVTALNDGSAPATNVRITITSSADIAQILPSGHEDIVIDKTSSDSAIIYVPRLSENKPIELQTILNGDIDDVKFAVMITYDQGENILYDSEKHGKKIISRVQIPEV